MRQSLFFPLLRELMQCVQQFERHSGAHVRSMGLMPAQFDILATLGNTQGMSCKMLGEKTLITKGTLTGVLDRLEARGLLQRHEDASDGRSSIVQLTPAGQALFEQVFPAHVAHLHALFDSFSDAELIAMRGHLQRMHHAFATATPAPSKESA
jgi:MarR family 2-MHQ and catechol resistance regulon transcriptional repressor